MDALAGLTTVAVVGGGYSKATVYSFGFFCGQFYTRAVSSPSTIVNVAYNKWRQLWNRATADNLEQSGNVGGYGRFIRDQSQNFKFLCEGG